MRLGVSICFLIFSSLLLVKPDCIETEVNFDFSGALPQQEACTVPLPRTPDPVIGGPPQVINFCGLIEKDLLPSLSYSLVDGYMAAVDELNEVAQTYGSNIQYTLTFENTRLNATYAGEKMQLLVSRGCNVVLGPLTCDEQLITAALASALGTTCITATASSIGLGFAPYVFRMIPNDEDQANALATYLWKNGFFSAIAIFRSDAFGVPFVGKFRDAYQNIGGNLTVTLSYNPYGFDPVSLAQQIDQSVQQGLGYISFGQNRIAVVMVMNEEWQTIVSAIRTPATLRQFWVGTSGVARVRQPSAAALNFVSLTGSLFSTGIYIPPSPLQENAAARLAYRGYQIPDPVSYLAYDSIMLAGYSSLMSRGTVNPGYSTGLNTIANVWVGSSGRLSLDQTGDRTYLRFTMENLNVSTGMWNMVGVFNPITLTYDMGQSLNL